MSASLLVEFLCEELPPKALKLLGESFAQGVRAGLAAKGLTKLDAQAVAFATPRRLAVRVNDVAHRSADAPKRDKVLPVSVAFDAAGKPLPPLLKKLAALGLSEADIPKLSRASDGKADALFHDYTAPGIALDHALGEIVRDALAKLPIPKVMSYQLPDLTTVQFVRPAHRVVALHDDRIVPIDVLGLQAGRTTLGHRFMSTGDIAIADADAYEKTLAHDGKVIASFDARRALIVRELETKARGDAIVQNDALLDEVTALVEWPVAYEAHFDPAFLDVPQECLILTMQLNQKYFALEDANGKLLNRFLLISNLAASDPSRIVGGNERVLRARLADAKFFYDTDRKQPLISHLYGLRSITYHNKLGSVFDRVQRIGQIAENVARQFLSSPQIREPVQRAAVLAKCDLLTGMVGEFPELQGLMGSYYARHDKEENSVCEAIRLQYRIRLAGQMTGLSQDDQAVVISLFIAERAETLVGIWGIGLQPTGEKDPFALRRAALGIIDAFELLQGGWVSGLFKIRGLLEDALSAFLAHGIEKGVVDSVEEFIYERYRNLLTTEFDKRVVDAVIAKRPELQDVREHIAAVIAFDRLDEAQSLAAANKRIGNILKKAEGPASHVRTELFKEPAETSLYQALEDLKSKLRNRSNPNDYVGELKALAALRDPVDAFFDGVMVMADDPGERANRIALLRELYAAMNRVADLSRLAA